MMDVLPEIAPDLPETASAYVARDYEMAALDLSRVHHSAPGVPGLWDRSDKRGTGTVKRREQWRRVLDREMKRWTAKSCEQLGAELAELQAYETEFESKTYQVEVEIVENTEKYVHVMVSVDDGSLPASLSPVSASFICEK